MYYCQQGYWKGIAAIKKLAEAVKVSGEALWQVFLPMPCYVNHQKFDAESPSEVQQPDLFSATRQADCCQCGHATTKKSNPSPHKTRLRWQNPFRRLTSVGLWNGPNFCRLTMGVNSWVLLPKRWKTTIGRGYTEINRNQAIVEHFNCTLWAPVRVPIQGQSAATWQQKINWVGGSTWA